MNQSEMLEKLQGLLQGESGFSGYGAPDGKPVLYFASEAEKMDFWKRISRTELAAALDAINVHAHIVGDLTAHRRLGEVEATPTPLHYVGGEFSGVLEKLSDFRDAHKEELRHLGVARVIVGGNQHRQPSLEFVFASNHAWERFEPNLSEQASEELKVAYAEMQELIEINRSVVFTPAFTEQGPSTK